jgi:carboxyl-terminal processing protease
MGFGYRLAGTAILGALLLVPPAVAAGDTTAASQPDMALIEQVMRRVESDYVHPVGPDELTTDALKGMLTRLDPHSDYMDEREYREMTQAIDGEFGGIGIRISENGGVPEVISPIDGTPAAHAGLEPGDRITAINGQATEGMDLERAVELLRGRPGSSVTLTILRSNKAPFPVTLVRASITVPTVTAKLEPHALGFLRISEFDANTPDTANTALAQLKREAGGQLRGLVLDLRNDPGGLLDAAVAVAGDFLDGGTVVSTRGRRERDSRIYDAPRGAEMIRGTPIVVLINSGSASAAEIVAGALKDRHRATLMGTTSFGKGSVQTIIPMAGQGALRLTTALYYTPSGRSLQGNGITPDISVPAPKDEQVANMVVTHESELHGAFAPTDGSHTPPEFSAPIKPKLIGTARDSQLKAALDYLDHKAPGTEASAH